MEFCDLKKQYHLYKNEIQDEINKVLESSAYINGPAVGELEDGLSSFAGVKHAISCSSGTDALLLPFMAYDIQPGDEIICPAFTFIATASMVAFYKAVPVFVDVDPVTFNIDTSKIEDKITSRTKGIIAVSLYGQMPDMEALKSIAKKHHLWLLEDGAQSYGATYNGSRSCSMSDVATTSFFPAKPLGGYGDGGAVFTNDDELAEKILMMRNHGQEKRYFHKYVGMNGRMDTIQAAVLKIKLRHFEEELKLREDAADRYTEMLEGFDTPIVAEGRTSSWAQYTIRINNRDRVQSYLAGKGIPTAIHYPMPLPHQEAFKDLPSSEDDYPVSDQLASTVLSLPMHALITEEEQNEVVNALKAARVE